MAQVPRSRFVCRSCNEEKPREEFPPNVLTRGKRPYCRVCISKLNGGRLETQSEKKLRQMRVYYVQNRESLRRKRDARYAALRDSIIDGYGGACTCCGEREKVFLSIDHINGGGQQERNRGQTGTTLYTRIRSEGFPDCFQILCYNCNAGKYRNGGICPHQLKERSTAIPFGSTLEAIARGSASGLG